MADKAEAGSDDAALAAAATVAAVTDADTEQLHKLGAGADDAAGSTTIVVAPAACVATTRPGPATDNS